MVFLNNNTSILCLGDYFNNDKRIINDKTIKRKEIHDFFSQKTQIPNDDDLLYD